MLNKAHNEGRMTGTKVGESAVRDLLV